MNALPRILVIDDEPQLRKLLRITLESAGFEVREATTGGEGLREAAFLKPDLVVLDLGLPDLDGREIVRRLREWSQTPILILSVRDDAAGKAAALDEGADDYVTKPFDGGELVARCRALLRRQAVRQDDAFYASGGLEVDFVAREIRVGGRRIELTATEYALLRLLALHAGKVLTHASILRQVWGPKAEDQRQYLRVHMAALRRKLGPEVAIVTAVGVGYRLVPGDD